MSNIQFLYTVNKKYFPFALSSIVSLVDNSGLFKDDIGVVHIITEGISNKDMELVKRINLIYPNVKIYCYPLENYNVATYNIPDWQNTQVANSRLFFQDILGNKVQEMEYLLYLDADTIVTGDLTKIKYATSLIAAVEDVLPKRYAESLQLSNYHNSGVLLIDIQKWLSDRSQEEIKEYIQTHSLKDLKYPDQDILNIVFQGSIFSLPRSYNLQTFAYALDGKSLEQYCNNRNISIQDITEAKDNPKILHSTAFLGIKPWMKNKIHPYSSIFNEYLYRVAPDFHADKPNGWKGLLAQNPFLFYLLYNINAYIPVSFNSKYCGNLPPLLEKSNIEIQKIMKR